MRLTDPLTDHQIAVLRWIAEGCPAGGVGDGTGYKHTARALHDRKLVAVSKAGGRWQARLTDAGEFYLANGAHPVAPRDTIPDRRQRGGETGPVKRHRVEGSVGDGEGERGRARQAVAVEVEELIRRLDEGTVTITDPPAATRAAWRRAIAAARSRGVVPDGERIVYRGRDHGDLVIEKQPMPPGSGAAMPRVLEIPETITRPHPLLRPASRPVSGLGVSEQAVARTIRLLHVLISAAEDEGCTVEWASGSSNGLVFRRDGQLVLAQVREESEQRDVLPDLSDAANGRRYGWQRVQLERREAPTGVLRVELDEDWTFRGRRRFWADRQRWRLEDKLGDVLGEIVHRLTCSAVRRQARERAAQQLRREWEAAMATARTAFHETQRVAELDHQLQGWERAERIRAYCAALNEVDDEHNQERRDWIAWAHTYADTLDPRGRHERVPDLTEPGPEELRYFLGRWSPYGPDRR